MTQQGEALAERMGLAEQGGEFKAADQLHREEVVPLGPATEAVDLDDPAVVESGGEERSAAKAGLRDRRRRPVELLDRHVLAPTLVVGVEHLAAGVLGEDTDDHQVIAPDLR